MFEIGDLRAFVRVAELLSLTAAAKSMQTPKSSVSRSMARLEQAAGVTLVERSSRHSRLTDAGELFYPHAKGILDNVEQAAACLSEHSGIPSGLIRINAPSSFSRCIIAPMLPAFLQAHPLVDVELVIDDERINMLAAKFDLTIRIGKMVDSELVARRIRTTELWTCASPGYLALKGIPENAGDLDGHTLVGRADRLISWLTAANSSTKVGTDVSGRVSSMATDVVYSVLCHGGGIGRLPDYLARSDVARGQLVRLFAEMPPECVDVYALYAQHRSLAGKVRVFIDALVEAIERASGDAFVTR